MREILAPTDLDVYEVAELAGVGTEYVVYAEAEPSRRCHLRVLSGHADHYLGYFPSFRDAVLEAVGRIEREIRENAGEPEPEPIELPPAPPEEVAR